MTRKNFETWCGHPTLAACKAWGVSPTYTLFSYTNVMNLYHHTEVNPHGRRLRDRAKVSFESGNLPEEWHDIASRAVTTDALTNGLNSREYAASVAMRARLKQRYELAGNPPYGEDDVLESFRFAMAHLRQPGKPDQYEINFIAGGAFAEATQTDGSRRDAFRQVGRSAWLAACSESPRLARETNPDLSSLERWKAKGRAFGRTVIAAIGAATGPTALKVKPFRRIASKLL